MNQLRHNTFNGIHKGLRCMLYDTAQKIQHTNFADSEESEETLQRIESVLLLFEHHGHHEDHFLFPNIGPTDSTIVKELEKEHVKDHELSSGLQNAVNEYRKAGNKVDRAIIGKNLLMLFNEFVAFNLQHMNKEEQHINPILWKNYTDEEIRAIDKKLVANVDPSILMKSGEWLMKGQNYLELFYWTNDLKHNAPPPVYEAVTNLGKHVYKEKWEVMMEKGASAAV